MANEEQLKLLKEEGVEAWNAWRQRYQEITIDLSCASLDEANLVEVNLVEANLRYADLPGANLRYADLIGANLHRANLGDADLSDVNLSGADLSEADLSYADLSGANLSEADLSEANLYLAILSRVDLGNTAPGGVDPVVAILTPANFAGVNLRQANLSGVDFGGVDLFLARLDATTFSNCNLSDVERLETVVHNGPSSLGIDTIFRSGGNIPHEFLRGCGVPDIFIKYMASLTGRAFEYYSAFISYSSANEAIANRIHADLQNAGVRCWYALHDMQIGAKIRPTIHEAIRVHEKLLLILSEDAINSDWVEDEVETALDRERESGAEILFPIRIDDAVMDSDAGWAASLRRKRHIGDFRRWKEHDAYQHAFERLLRDLKGKSVP